MHALDTLAQVWGLIAIWFTYASYCYVGVLGILIAIGIIIEYNELK